MDKNSIIKIKDINVTDLAGEKVMIDFDTGKYYMIKGVGNDIWDMLKEETRPVTIIDNLLKEYDISVEECENEVMAFLGKLQEMGFLSVM